MSYDDVPLPTNKNRRRSIFEDETDTQEEAVNLFPTEISGLCYPVDYVEKVRTEIELWRMHINKTLDENHKFKAEKTELQNTTLDENILSSQQLDSLTSFNFGEYVKRVKNFCDRAEIISHTMQYKIEDKRQYVANKLKLDKVVQKMVTE
ncbi:hypothetical protein NQ315_002727 [Exocentrus adspersus]|uniref:Uncharacterized protein n=1 Tax=Exocentrus adspersus TaxID=1586481 RepID=A0AAV8V8J9_9CUCU|nr:hypothetical protein NQ315_002727 [Exocentrus adspersus]